MGSVRRTGTYTTDKISAAIFRETGFDELADEGGGKRFIGLKTDGPFAGFVTFQIFLVSGHNCSTERIERTVISGCAKTDEYSILAEGRDLIADTLLGLWRGGADGFSQFLECGAFVGGEAGEIVVDSFGFMPGHRLL